MSGDELDIKQLFSYKKITSEVLPYKLIFLRPWVNLELC